MAGYWIDRSLFPYARPDVFLALKGLKSEPLPRWSVTLTVTRVCWSYRPNEGLMRVMGICMLRRAIIVAATMLAVGLGA